MTPAIRITFISRGSKEDGTGPPWLRKRSSSSVMFAPFKSVEFISTHQGHCTWKLTRRRMSLSSRAIFLFRGAKTSNRAAAIRSRGDQERISTRGVADCENLRKIFAMNSTATPDLFAIQVKACHAIRRRLQLSCIQQLRAFALPSDFYRLTGNTLRWVWPCRQTRRF